MDATIRARATYLRHDDGAALYRVKVEAEDVTTAALDGAFVELTLTVARDGADLDATAAEGVQFEAGVDGWADLGGEARTVAALPEVMAAVRGAIAEVDYQRARRVVVGALQLMQGM